MGVLAVLGTKPDYMQVFFTFEELDNHRGKDDLAINAFKQMYGYLPNTHEDKQRHYEYWAQMVNEAQKELDLQSDRLRSYKLRQLEAYESMEKI